MTVPRLRTAPEPEQEWQKWTPEEKEKALQEFREKAGIIPHRKQTAKAVPSTETLASDTRNSVAYVPKPTHNPNAATDRNNDNGNSSSDTHMHDATAEEEKKCSNSCKTISQMGDTKKVTWAEKNGALMKDSNKGVNKTTKRHHGTAEQ